MNVDLQLSQASLQDYMDCRRRFYLRYILKLEWPGHQTDRAEQLQIRAQRGVAFHRLVHQHVVGISEDRLTAIAAGAGLDAWWNSYLQHPVSGLQGKNYAEISLSAPVSHHRLVAKYDLVSIGSRVMIVDWKTSKRRDETWLRSRMQTRVYQYLMVRAGKILHGGIDPGKVEMVYWFADDPQAPARLAYDNQQFEQDDQDLHALVAEIESQAEDEFVLTDDLSHCRFCPFRSLCDRGVSPGALDEFEAIWQAEEGIPADIDFDQIGEIAF
jgi:RecB family exonuclease